MDRISINEIKPQRIADLRKNQEKLNDFIIKHPFPAIPNHF